MWYTKAEFTQTIKSGNFLSRSRNVSIFDDKIGPFYDMLSYDWSAAFVFVDNT